MAEVVLQSVGKVYRDGTRAVDDLNLDIADGEFVVIVGPSGSGKTTALRMVAGLEEVTDGEIWIGDRVVNDLSPKERDIAMVFQNYALYPHMTVEKNLAFGLKLRKLPKPEIARRVDGAATALEIDDFLQRKPGALSGGQRQRVAMGRAIVREPTVYLMDEPLSNLDAQLRVHMRAEIGRLQRRLGVTTIYVTHDQVEAMTMSDRVAVMRQGKLQQFAAPQEVYNRPTNVFVGGFIGSPAMNLLEGTIEHLNGNVAVALGDQRLALDADVLDRRPQLRDYEGNRLIVGIRPEDIDDAKLASNGSPDRRLQGTVELREALGPELSIHFTVPGVRPADTQSIAELARDIGTVGVERDAGAMFVGRFGPHSEVHEGGPVDAVVDTSALHFFDPDTGVGIY